MTGTTTTLVLLTLSLCILDISAWKFPLPFQNPVDPQPQVDTDTEEFTMTLLHTNDVHARFEEFDKNGGPCTERSDQCYGGVARRHTKIQELRRTHENVLLLDAGDQYQGTLWFVYYGGRAARYFMDLLGYDVMTLGNHEFDRGVQGIVPFLENVSFPVVSSNIDTSADDRIDGLFNKSVVLDVDGKKVGVVGVITHETKELVNPKDIDKIVFKDEVTSVQEEVNKLKEAGINIIIGLSHSGYGMDRKIAEQVDGLDLIIGGHTNTFLYTGDAPDIEVPIDVYPVWVRQESGKEVAVVQDFTYGKYLGLLKVTFNSQGELVKSKTQGNPILLDSSVSQDPDVLRQVNEWREPMDHLSKQKVGSTLVYLEGRREVCRLGECNMGNVMTEAMLLATYNKKPPTGTAWSDFSIAIWNSGGIRSSINIGEFTLENVLSVFPFQNTISVVVVHGSGLLRILEHAVAHYNPVDAPGAFLQVSGLHITYNLKQPSGHRVVSVSVRCANCSVPSFSPLDLDKEYSVVTSDFLINGGDGYKVIKETMIREIPLNILDVNAFIGYCQVRQQIMQGTDGRIKFDNSEIISGVSRLIPNILMSLLGICFVLLHL